MDSLPLVTTIAANLVKTRFGTCIDQTKLTKAVSIGGTEMFKLIADCDDDTAMRLLDEFRAIYAKTPTPKNSLYPGVLEAMNLLFDQQQTLAICSNKPQNLIEKILDELALTSHFEIVIGTGAGQPRKPNPWSTNIILEHTGIAADQAVFIGDSSVDQRTAEASLIDFAFFSAGYDDGVDLSTTWLDFNHYDEFLELLQRIETAI